MAWVVIQLGGNAVLPGCLTAEIFYITIWLLNNLNYQHYAKILFIAHVMVTFHVYLKDEVAECSQLVGSEWVIFSQTRRWPHGRSHDKAMRWAAGRWRGR